jgi:GDP-L-fucose synthase
MYSPLLEVPFEENDILKGSLESTNEGYALSKIAGLKLCDYYMNQYDNNYISLIPSNVYGVVDRHPLKKNHAVSALMKKMHTAKKRGDEYVEIMGTGESIRDYLHVYDLCDAIIFMMNNFKEPGGINIGTKNSISIRDLANKIKDIVGYDGELIYLKQYPDGMLRKYLDTSKADKLGWEPKINIDTGLEMMYREYVNGLC